MFINCYILLMGVLFFFFCLECWRILVLFGKLFNMFNFFLIFVILDFKLFWNGGDDMVIGKGVLLVFFFFLVECLIFLFFFLFWKFFWLVLSSVNVVLKCLLFMIFFVFFLIFKWLRIFCIILWRMLKFIVLSLGVFKERFSSWFNFIFIVMVLVVF